MQYLLPLLVAVAVAKSVGNYFNISIYDMQIKKKRFPFLHDRLKFKSRSGQRENAVTCEQIMATKVRVLGLSDFLLAVASEQARGRETSAGQAAAVCT